jgi:hypothetical protein
MRVVVARVASERVDAETSRDRQPPRRYTLPGLRRAGMGIMSDWNGP